MEIKNKTATSWKLKKNKNKVKGNWNKRLELDSSKNTGARATLKG